jgi:hypothetical protein
MCIGCSEVRIILNCAATLNLRTSDGSISSASAATIAVAQPYCQKLYNRDDAPVDQTVLDEIKQRPVISRLAEPPTYDEFEKAIFKLAYGKAPGESGVTAEAIKAVPRTALDELHGIYRNYLNRLNDCSRRMILRLLYKSKGDSAELKNYRGILLQDLFARLMSSIINFRLTTIIEAYGLDEQFGYTPGKGTIDALFAIRATL